MIGGGGGTVGGLVAKDEELGKGVGVLGQRSKNVVGKRSGGQVQYSGVRNPGPDRAKGHGEKRKKNRSSAEVDSI